jgi:hypothetical protein
VASLIALAMSNRQIAEQLVLSERTVETHVRSILAKLGYSTRTILVTIGTAVFPSTKGYVHFQFSDYAKLTIIGVVIACLAWPVVTRISVIGHRDLGLHSGR